MRILLYTDNHFCTNSSIIRKNGEKYSIRLENQIKSVNWAEQLGIEKKCDMVIHLGDFFDKSELTAQELTALKEIKWNDLPHYFLVGNHEMGSADLQYNSLNALSKIGRIINEPYYMSGFGYRIIFLPYILETNRKPLQYYIDSAIGDSWETQEVKNTIILSHNDISGLQYGQYISKQGFGVQEIYDSCNLFVNGHLHNQTQINDKMLNLGNLTGQNFSEDAFKYSHCVAILDTDTLKIDLINNPYAFNFYKLNVNDEKDLDVFNKLVAPTIITVSTPIDLVDKVKECISNFNNTIIESRVVGKPIKKEIEEKDVEIVNVDHIKQFKDYILKTIDNSDLLTEELNLL